MNTIPSPLIVYNQIDVMVLIQQCNLFGYSYEKHGTYLTGTLNRVVVLNQSLMVYIWLHRVLLMTYI